MGLKQSLFTKQDEQNIINNVLPKSSIKIIFANGNETTFTCAMSPTDFMFLIDRNHKNKIKILSNQNAFIEFKKRNVIFYDVCSI